MNKFKIMHAASISFRFAFIVIFNIKFKSNNNENATFASAFVSGRFFILDKKRSIIRKKLGDLVTQTSFFKSKYKRKI